MFVSESKLLETGEKKKTWKDGEKRPLDQKLCEYKEKIKKNLQH